MVVPEQKNKSFALSAAGQPTNEKSRLRSHATEQRYGLS